MTTKGNRPASRPARKGLAATIAATKFGAFVRAIRESDEVKQAELGRRLKISRQFLSAVELGRSHIGLDFAKRVADALGYAPEPFAEILIREQLNKAGIKCEVTLTRRSTAA
jgi:transcriptional regulator with XRE-family HTH domain